MPFTPLLGLFGVGAAELLVIFLVFAAFAFWVWMVVDCAVHEQSNGAKIGWIIALVLVGLFAAPLYFFFRRVPRANKAARERAESIPPPVTPIGPR